MKQNKKNLLRIGLQFFADPQPGTEPGTNPQPGADPGATESTPATPPEGKTYTQEQLNALMANEKRTARNAILKELGFDVKDDKGYKETMADIKKTLDAGKTEQQLDKEAAQNAQAAQAAAESKAAALEMKLAAISKGVKPDCVDDVIALIAPKISETNTIETLLEECAKKYPVFFTEDSNSSGTGSSVNPPKKTSGGESLGQRLAKSHKSTTAKSTYFKK